MKHGIKSRQTPVETNTEQAELLRELHSYGMSYGDIDKTIDQLKKLSVKTRNNYMDLLRMKVKLVGEEYKKGIA